MSAGMIQERIARVPRWYHQIELGEGVVTPGINESAEALEKLRLPADLRGCRVLDLGTRDGFYAFECERRGADVLAVDYFPKEDTGFAVAAELLGSQVRFEQANVTELSPARFGRFDVVLCLGLLYHLRAPLDVLDRVRSVCDDRLWLESLVVDSQLDVPVMQFFPRDSRGGDWSNFWGPNQRCLEAMVVEAGFTVERSESAGERGIIEARASNDAHLDYHARIARGDRLPLG